MSEILTDSLTDPHGDKMMEALSRLDLSILSLDELAVRIEQLRAEIKRTEQEREKRGGAAEAAEALFKS